MAGNVGHYNVASEIESLGHFEKYKAQERFGTFSTLENLIRAPMEARDGSP